MGQTSASLSHRSGSRIAYLDLLRIIAIYTTVVIHIITQVWNGADIHGFSWKVYNFFLSASSWGVPVFVMISGALFLDPGRLVDTKKLYTKNILRLVLAFCFWSLVYAAVFDIRGKSIEYFFYSIFTGEFHMWYVVMILVMYMLTPLLRRFTDDLSLTAYFLKLSFAVSFLLPQVFFLLEFLNVPYLCNMIQGLSRTSGNLAGYFPHFYLFYFVAGQFITRTEFTARQRRILYLLGIAGFLATVTATDLYSASLGSENQYFYGKDTLNILLMTVAVFVFAKYELSRIHFSGKGLSILRKVSDCCMGIYFIHLLIIKAVYGLFDLSLMEIHPIVRCTVHPAVFFAASLVAVLIMKRLPGLKKTV